jgi:tetratricopeptide (TPR) repeat protein
VHFCDITHRYERLGALHLSLQHHEECLQLRRSFLSPSHPDVLLSEAELSICWFDSGRQQDGMRLLEKVMVEARRVLPPTHSHLGLFMNQLGTLYGKAGRYAQSLQLFEEQLAFCKVVMEPNNIRYVELHFSMGITLFALGRKQQARSSIAESLRVAEFNQLEDEHEFVVKARSFMCMLH